ncbi:M20 metallopeptidase family protein [Glaciecola sp. 1036]|uniref:M20 metallopeptidase family protein n=1 Tax=Alteromonadaceae TaxID=72275 RepID=UPI003D09106D
MKTLNIIVFVWLCLVSASSFANLTKEIEKDYQAYLKELFIHFHQNPELSMAETKTAARIAKDLKALGFTVHEGIAETGIIATLKNGKGPTVMMRADMDGLPVKEASGLDYASQAMQFDPITKEERPVMHACGHDVHITSLIGTARYMTTHKDDWSGTLMLVAQPAEERIMGARKMMEENIWETYGKPDYALALHVSSNFETGKINVFAGPTSAGSNSVDIIVHGIGTHGAYPQGGKDPVVLGSQIVLALQTLVSRELGPKEPGVVTVGAFNSGFKHNIISDKAHLKITVRSATIETRDKLLDGIKRIAENMGRVAGLPEDKLPEVRVSLEEGTLPQINDDALTARLQKAWKQQLGASNLMEKPSEGMGAEDFPYFVHEHNIPSVYWSVGGTPKADFEKAANGGPAVPSHHSPLFKIEPDGSVPFAVETTVTALLDLLQE